MTDLTGICLDVVSGSYLLFPLNAPFAPEESCK